jgi:hypothetical protein
MRVVKHKATGGGLKASLQHLHRERDTPNADPEVSNLKWSEKDGEQTTQHAMQKLHSKMNDVVKSSGRKIRKDSVVAVEYVMTASPEYFDQFKDKDERMSKVNEFAQRSRAWIEKQYPDGKIIAAQVHMDEATPHVSLFVTPTFKNKNGDISFSAKTILGGRQRLSEHQDSFSKAMEPLGLKRGIKGSKATHEKVSRFYASVVKSAADVENIYGKDVEKIDKLASFKRLNGKAELAEYAKELAHDNLKLRHVISDRDPQKQIESITKAHKLELSQNADSYQENLKFVRSRLAASNTRVINLENQIDQISQPFMSEIEELKTQVLEGEQKLTEMGEKLEEIKTDFDINANHLEAYTSRLWSPDSEFATSEDALKLRSEATHEHMQFTLDQNLLQIDEFPSDMVEEFESYEYSHAEVHDM